jgi:hypothetical protein
MLNAINWRSTIVSLIVFAIVSVAVPPAMADTVIASKESAKCLDIIDNSQYADAPLQHYTCLGTNNQLFKFDTIAISPDSTEIVHIKVVSTGMCLSIYNSSLQPGYPIVQEVCNGTPQQNWNLGRVAGPISFNTSSTSFYTINSVALGRKITNTYNGLCIEAQTGTNQIYQNTCTATANQQWLMSYY